MFNNLSPARSGSCLYCGGGYGEQEKGAWCFDADLKLAGTVHLIHRAQWCHANGLAWHHADENGLPLVEAHRHAWQVPHPDGGAGVCSREFAGVHVCGEMYH